MIRRPRRSTRFPSTTLFRSPPQVRARHARVQDVADDRHPQAVDAAEPLANRKQVEQRLGRVRAEARSEEHTSELQSRQYLVCRLLLEKNNTIVTGQSDTSLA